MEYRIWWWNGSTLLELCRLLCGEMLPLHKCSYTRSSLSRAVRAMGESPGGPAFGGLVEPWFKVSVGRCRPSEIIFVKSWGKEKHKRVFASCEPERL